MPAHIEVYFPPLATADADGLLMLGGELTPEWILEAYRRAIFPWPILHRGMEILAWFSPDPRAILELSQVHVSRRLARRLRRGEFELTCDRDFTGVMAGCAGPRRQQPVPGTWITPAMQAAYGHLHQLGYAHSVEAWQDGQLVGGVYGVALGGMFAGESMFHRVRDASKAALVALAGHLASRGYTLLDIQQATPHTASLGATEIRRSLYCRRLREALARPVHFGSRLEFDASTLGRDS
ncbi:MAG: leucyl/phenylalanyl-tRNA--protein transferase [Pirellulaceae bacterium]|nr:leucyl/phenylalanyl-tRNA--protein transferase [Pirellulaceae bacterium]